ncbi:MAG: potassium-transporting ATPase subunit F [Deltaproteobacteria bacterium]|nr:potassium-transporting ATPase subunit F [Deltaproteobacteria bacterium]
MYDIGLLFVSTLVLIYLFITLLFPEKF